MLLAHPPLDAGKDWGALAMRHAIKLPKMCRSANGRNCLSANSRSLNAFCFAESPLRSAVSFVESSPSFLPCRALVGFTVAAIAAPSTFIFGILGAGVKIGKRVVKMNLHFASVLFGYTIMYPVDRHLSRTKNVRLIIDFPEAKAGHSYVKYFPAL